MQINDSCIIWPYNISVSIATEYIIDITSNITENSYLFSDIY